MNRLMLKLAALSLGVVLQGCGGGDGGGPPPAAPPPPAPSKLTLTSSNYLNAIKVALGSANSAFTNAKLAIGITNSLLNVPLGALPLIPCPASGTISYLLTDKNGDQSLDPNDTIHITWDHCKSQQTTTTGLVRVEVNTATQIPDGRDYMLTITIAGLKIENDNSAAPPATINAIVPVHHTFTSTYEHTVVSGAAFNSGLIAGDTGAATVFIDYLQDFATQTYSYSVSGTVDSGGLGGQFDFTTALPLSGVIGEYPSAGRLDLTGNANSSARLSEEGVAAADNSAVFVAVDSNGDGVADTTDAQLAWSSIAPVQIFATFVNQVAIYVPAP